MKRLAALIVALAILALLCAPLLAVAAVVGIVDSPQGRIDLFDEPGDCRGNARRAEFVPPAGKPVPGCWVAGPGVVLVVFLDADIALVPMARVRPPTSS